MSEQQLFNILAEVNKEFVASATENGNKYSVYMRLVPRELLSYIEINHNNLKAMTRLTSYLYLNMDEEFNEHLIESESNDYVDERLKNLVGDGFDDAVAYIIHDIEHDLRSYERGEKDLTNVNMHKLSKMTKDQLMIELSRHGKNFEVVMNNYAEYLKEETNKGYLSSGITKLLELIEIKVILLKESDHKVEYKNIIFRNASKLLVEIILSPEQP